MNILRTLIYIVIIAFATSCSAKGQSNPVVSKTFRDSIIDLYVTNGAHLFPIFSKGWQSNLDKALVYLPEDAYLWQQKAMPCFKQMKYEVGMSYLDSAVKYNPEQYIDYRAFIKCIFQKNYLGAIGDFKMAKGIKGVRGIVMDHEYDFYIGISYMQLNQYDSALYYLSSDYKSVTTSKGDDWISYLTPFYMGVCLYEQRSYDSAILYFNKALKIYPKFSDAKYYKGICLLNQANFNTALNLMSEANNDLSQGYTINEANTKYEKYPYQINKELIDFFVGKIKEQIEYKKVVNTENVEREK